MSVTFTCPDCGMVSYNEHDAMAGYCGNCHEFTGVPHYVGGERIHVHKASDREHHDDEPVMMVNADDASIKVGERIEKCNTEPGDSFPDGTMGTVVTGLMVDGIEAYFVEWDPLPGVPVLIVAQRVRPAT